MIKLVVFDWNGTLLADARGIVEGVNIELGVLGKPPITLKYYRDNYDVPLVHFFEKLGIKPEEFKAKSSQVAAAFHPFYEARVAHARTRRGAKELLDALRHRGIINILLSNHTMEGIYLQLERLNLSHHFEAVLANDGFGKSHFSGKQHRLEEYMKSHGISAHETAIVGDTIEEIRIGKNLGIKTIALTGGYNSTRRLKEAKPDVLIHKLRDIIKALEEW
ncbi:MAG TPA: HAD family hydrolase [Candidatus Saccharimonadales bacterium]|nr:HAD family hydrolase [Candidatus Saccharimonadales bacterium]